MLLCTSHINPDKELQSVCPCSIHQLMLQGLVNQSPNNPCQESMYLEIFMSEKVESKETDLSVLSGNIKVCSTLDIN